MVIGKHATCILCIALKSTNTIISDLLRSLKTTLAAQQKDAEAWSHGKRKNERADIKARYNFSLELEQEKVERAAERYKNALDKVRADRDAKLREDLELSELEQQIVDGLDTALPKLPTYQGTLYRNIGFDGFGDQEARDTFVAKHGVGALVGYPAYTSTSTDVDGYPVEGDCVVHMVIEGETGRDLSGYGNDSESEVLFERRKKFEVTKIVYDENGTPTIYMTEVVANGEVEQNGETGAGDHSGRVSRGAGERNTPGGNQSNLQSVREAGAGREVQRAPEGNTRFDSVQGAGVQGVSEEVTKGG